MCHPHTLHLDRGEFRAPDNGANGWGVDPEHWATLVVDLGECQDALRIKAALGNRWGKLELVHGLNGLNSRIDKIPVPQLVVLALEQFGDEWPNLIGSLTSSRSHVLFLAISQTRQGATGEEGLNLFTARVDENPTDGYLAHVSWEELEDPQAQSAVLGRLAEIHHARHSNDGIRW